MTETDRRMLKRHQKSERIDEVRKKTSHQGAFEESFLHFDHPLLAGGRCLEPSDHGKSAAVIFDAAEVTPLWLRLWRIQYAKLPRKAKRILDAMLVDERSRPAARIAGVDHKTVDAWKIKFKVHFDQCLSAYYAFLGGKKFPAFFENHE